MTTAVPRLSPRPDGLLVSAVSDTHTAVEVGRTYVDIPEFDATAEGLMKALSQGTLVRRPITPLIHLATTFTKIKKRFLGRGVPRP